MNETSPATQETIALIKYFEFFIPDSCPVAVVIILAHPAQG